jgi:apolipoprotein D and lipocalin family protein
MWGWVSFEIARASRSNRSPVVGDPSRDYLWILGRTPELADEPTTAARAAARNNGFDVERLVLTPQTEASR